MDSIPAEPVSHAHVLAADGLHLAQRQRARPAGDDCPINWNLFYIFLIGKNI